MFFNGLLDRACELTEDPLQQLLIFLKLLAEAMADLPGAHAGCLVASFTYELNQFDQEIRELNAQGLFSWRRTFSSMLDRAADAYELNSDESTAELADMLPSVIEGGIILSRCLDDKDILPNHLLQFRQYVRLLFGPRKEMH